MQTWTEAICRAHPGVSLDDLDGLSITSDAAGSQVVRVWHCS